MRDEIVAALQKMIQAKISRPWRTRWTGCIWP